MKVAVIYNRESNKVINLFGVPNREKYGLAAIHRITNSLKQGGHQVIALEGDKDLVDNLEKFMPQVLKGERPGMALNLSYGIQGQARYTHVPSILEMIGIPYVGSGPLAHTLALDKVVAKMLFKQNNLPTPDFAVLMDPAFVSPSLDYPLIVKPKNEAVSFGIRIVNNEQELREAAQVIFDQFQQAVLVEEYIEGREINVGILGNQPAEALPPAEIIFGEGGPNIYTYEDKSRQSGRSVDVICPAPIDTELSSRAQDIAVNAFNALGCYDCARIDMRLDAEGNFYILEVNSLPSLGEHGSYVAGAQVVGFDFAGLVNRLVEIASARYFGTPVPPEVTSEPASPSEAVFLHLTQHRDKMESRLQELVGFSSRSDDPVGIQLMFQEMEKTLKSTGLIPAKELCDKPHVMTWQTPAGIDNGALLIAHVDVPISAVGSFESFHRNPEWLYGEGIGSSRAPLVTLEYSLRALKTARQLKKTPMGVLLYADEGQEAQNSADMIIEAAARAKRVFVLRPGNLGDRIITQRRGQRKYRLVVESKSLTPGHNSRQPDALSWLFPRLDAITALSIRKERIAVAVVDVKPEAFPLHLPHRVNVTLQISFPSSARADQAEQDIKSILGKTGPRWSLTKMTDRAPMKDRKINKSLLNNLSSLGKHWNIPVGAESSVWPSVAGLVPEKVPTLCGLGPVATNLYTAQEAVSRISLIQRTLLLSEMLLKENTD